MQDRQEQETEVTKLGQIKSEPAKSEIVTSCANSVPNAKESEERKKAKRVKRALAIVEAGDDQVAMFGRLQANSARILWRAYG